MSKFKFVKRLDLAPFGAAEGSYLEFAPMTYKEGKELRNIKSSNPDAPEDEQMLEVAELIMGWLRDKFIGGEIGGVKVEATDLEELDPLVIAGARKLVIPVEPSPNS